MQDFRGFWKLLAAPTVLGGTVLVHRRSADLFSFGDRPRSFGSEVDRLVRKTMAAAESAKIIAVA